MKFLFKFLFLTFFYIFQLPIIILCWALGWACEAIFHDGSGPRINPIAEWWKDPFTWEDIKNKLRN